MNPTCATGKVCFPSSASARHVLHMQRAHNADPAKRVYHCPICGHWHLTKHRPPYHRKRRTEGGPA